MKPRTKNGKQLAKWAKARTIKLPEYIIKEIEKIEKIVKTSREYIRNKNENS